MPCWTPTRSGRATARAAAHRHPRLAGGADATREFVLFEEYFKPQGLECVIADPREVEYRDGKLMAGDFHITLIYKRVLDQRTDRARRDGSSRGAGGARQGVCMVNPFRCKILHKKASLAVLADERNARLFTADEQEAIAAHIPWTRLRRGAHTKLYRGQRVDLVPFIVEHRERLVLKPNDEYGGKGIVLGWETTPAAVGAGDAGRAGRASTSCRSASPSRANPIPTWLTGSCSFSTVCWTRTRSSSTAITWMAASRASRPRRC